MMLVALELIVGANMGITIRKISDQTNCDLIVFQMVEKATTLGFTLVQGPARTVYYQPWLMMLGGNLPQLFDPYTIMLGVFTRIQRILGN